MTGPALRVVVADDDPQARRRILALLGDEPGIEVAGECANGAEAIEAIRSADPAVVFLDVQMPGVDGFGVVEAVGHGRMPVVVFVSAYEEFALRAFDACALDYLLKPFEDERFRAMLARARAAAAARRGPADARIDALVELLRQGGKAEYPRLIAVKVGDVYRFVEVKEIDWAEADGNHVRLHIGKTERILHRTLTEVQERLLDPAAFVRIHRSTIVNLASVAAAEPLPAGDLSVLLKTGVRLACSRRFRADLQARVHFLS